MANLEWHVDIYWNGWTGISTPTDEASRLRAYSITRGRTTFVAKDGNGFEPIPPGALTITLDNFDGRYDPYNSGGALYPNVAAGKKIRVSADYDGDEYYRFTGFIESIEPTGGSTNPQVVITAYDLLKVLQEQDVSSAVYQAQSTGYCIRRILPAVSSWSIEDGADDILYFHINGIKIFDAVWKICNYESGSFWVDADYSGVYRFVGRNNAPPSVVTIDQSEMLKDVQIPMPYNVIRNCVKVYSYPKTLQTTAALWKLGDKPYVGPSSSIEVWGDFKYDGRSVAAINTAQPVATTDYLMNTAADGTGTNKTADFTVAATYFGETVKNVITNNGTAAGAYVTFLQNRGQAVDTPYTSYAMADTSGTDIKRMFIIDTPWMQDTNKAQQYADYLLDILSEPRKYPVFQLENQFDKQFSFDLLDRITVTMAKFGISQDFRVGGIEEEWLSENGQAVRTTVYTEPFVSATPEEGYWFFPMTFPTVFPY